MPPHIELLKDLDETVDENVTIIFNFFVLCTQGDVIE